MLLYLFYRSLAIKEPRRVNNGILNFINKHCFCLTTICDRILYTVYSLNFWNIQNIIFQLLTIQAEASKESLLFPISMLPRVLFPEPIIINLNIIMKRKCNELIIKILTCFSYYSQTLMY